MQRNSMGSFIAALRRSRGLTQSEVAESLSVSNKAVSKWERDENYPDVALIPAIAELFGVTSDDLLRGGPSSASPTPSAGGEAKAEKLARRLVKKKLNSVALYSWLAIGLVFLGFMTMLTLSYAAYFPRLGFGLLMAFAGGAVILQILVFVTQRIDPDELDFALEDGAAKRIQSTAAAYSLATFLSAAIAFMFSLSLLILSTEGTDLTRAVATIETYAGSFPMLTIISMVLISAGLHFYRKKYGVTLPPPPGRRLFNLIFGVLIALNALAEMQVWLFGSSNYGGAVYDAFYLLLQLGTIAGIIAYIAVHIVYLIKAKKLPRPDRLLLWLTAARNTFFLAAAVLFETNIRYIYTRVQSSGNMVTEVRTSPLALTLAVLLFAATIVVYEVFASDIHKQRLAAAKD